MEQEGWSVTMEKSGVTNPGGAMRKVELVCNLAPGKKVAVAGSFNDWEPELNPMVDAGGNGSYRCTLSLAPGYYEYKFVVDGDWVLDESNPNFTSNAFGTLNSVLNVK